VAHSGTIHGQLMPLKIFFAKFLFSEHSFQKVPHVSIRVHEWEKSLESHENLFEKQRNFTFTKNKNELS
jgi:hypothetical protein